MLSIQARCLDWTPSTVRMDAASQKRKLAQLDWSFGCPTNVCNFLVRAPFALTSTQSFVFHDSLIHAAAAAWIAIFESSRGTTVEKQYTFFWFQVELRTYHTIRKNHGVAMANRGTKQAGADLLCPVLPTGRYRSPYEYSYVKRHPRHHTVHTYCTSP